MTLFQDKFRVESARLVDHDYSATGHYLVTICTAERLRLFGHVEDGQMYLNTFGELVERHWQAIPGHYTHVRLDEHVIMPNHLHGIIELTPGLKPFTEARQRWDRNPSYKEISPKSGSLGAIIRSFKAGVTKEGSNGLHLGFKWQA